MYPRKIFLVLLALMCLTQLTQAGVQATLSPDGGHSNQNQINTALAQGNVYLNAGVYEVDGTITISSDRVLSGDPNAIIRVWSGSSQWFTGSTGIISSSGIINNIEISGFQVDGNIANLPSSYADSRADTSHDCERCILLRGASNQFGSNIKIHDMTLHDSFSDGVYVIFCDGVDCYNNIISDCQHEGVYFSCLKNSIMRGNKIAGICSDEARLDNCVNCKVYDNLFFSFTGESYGQYKGGQAGIQTGDSGSSHGYDASKKPQSTKNLEIYNNTFSSPGRMAIWNHADGSANVYIHNNLFIDSTGLETQGTSIGEIAQNISESNPPTLEMSKSIFNILDDLMNRDYTNSGSTSQTGDSIHYSVKTYEKGRIAGGLAIVGFKNAIKLDNHTYISSANDTLVKTELVSIGSLDPTTKQSKMEKNVTTDIKNGIATATLNVKLTYYTVKNGSNGKASFVSHSTTATFTTSAKAPEILSRNLNVSGTVDDYQQKSNPNTRVFVPYEAATQSIEYVYDGQSETHTFMLGERLTDSSGVEYTSYSRVNQWDGGLNHMSDSCIIHDSHFDPAKLKVVYRTPFENVTVADLKITEHNAPSEKWQVPELGFILRTFFMLWIGYRLMKLIFS